MDSEIFQAPCDSDPNWTIAKSFFRELVSTTRMKVRWPGNGDAEGSLGGLGKDDREGFDSWRRDAGEVIVGAYVSVLTLGDSSIKYQVLHSEGRDDGGSDEVGY